MVTTFYPPWSFGGDAVYVEQLALGLARRGHEVHVVHCTDAYRALDRSGPRQRARREHPNLTVHGLASRAGVLSPLLTQQTGWSGLKARPLRALLEGSRWDVIHYHNMSLMGLSALGWGDAVKLYTVHEYWLVCPMHVLWKFDREPCEQPACVLCTLHGGRPPQLWRHTGLLQRSLRHVDRFLSGAPVAAEHHRRAGLELPFVILPAFTAAEDDGAAAPHPEALAGPYFLFAGRLETIKGLHTILPFFRRHPEHRLLVAGDGSRAAALRADAGDAPNVRFLGWQTAPALRALYRGATALVMPSLTYEIAPQVGVEAFHQGTPIIARDLGSMTEMAEGRGLLFRDDASLAEAVTRLAADPALRQRLSHNAAEAARTVWSADNHIARYLALIEEVRAERAGAARPGPPA